MREIKFRAFLKVKKKMLPVTYLTLSDEEGEQVGVADCNNEGCVLCVDYYDYEKVELMQYTGLKDKNGREIYEGDIYECNIYPAGDDKDIFTVVWFDTGLVGKQKSSNNHFGLKYWLDKIEVIGNIYENPELLNTQ